MKALLFQSTRVIALIAIGLWLCTSSEAQECICPKFEIVSPLERVKAGETVEFEVTSADPAVLDGKFTWTTSAGKVISGQGTRKIVVLTSVEMLPPPASSTGIFIERRGGRSVPLKVTAIPTETGCACSPVSGSVHVGFRTEALNKPADITDLELSSEKLTLPCSPGSLPREGVVVSPTMVVDVAVTARDPEDDILSYYWTISGGRIVGTGSKVQWDLSDVAPGNYTITAGADDGCGVCGKTQTKTVTVVACEPTCALCECATAEIAGPTDDVLKAGENIFTANVTAGSYDPIYNWSADGGEIVSGQGTPSITVKLDQGSLESRVLVKLEIGGAPSSCSCISEYIVEYVNGRRKP